MIIFDESENVELFENAMGTFDNLENVVDKLYDKTENYRKKY
jgi:hypothetical protein